MVGLPIDSTSDTSLASLAAEAELERRVRSLREELASTEKVLEQLKHNKSDGQENHDSNGSDNDSKLVLPPPGKRGYLFKWLDRSIGWGGTKWALRFVVLENGRLSYFGSHLDNAPRYVLPLQGCAVREDGWKRNRRHVSKGKGENPPLDEPGAYFFVFSVYQRQGNEQDDSDIVPLLRFSTPSMAEKNQWVKIISEACAYCETDAYVIDETRRSAEIELQQQEQRKMALAMPEAKEGTLPPLFFAPEARAHVRRPSFAKLKPAKLFRTTSRNFDADKLESRSRKGYPPSKPMHRAAGPSYLSVEAPVQNYRGFLNLGIIVLIVSNFRLILDTVKRNGFVVTRALQHLSDLRHISRDPWEEFPFVSGFLLQLVFVTFAFVIEWLLSRKRVYEPVGLILHHINAHAVLFVSLIIVWNLIENPVTGAILAFHSVITWMKLLSYALANEDYRLSSGGKEDSHQATLALIEDLDPQDEHISYPKNVTIGNMFYFWFAPTLTYQIAFPKSPRVRPLKVVDILFRMTVVLALFTFLVAQIVSPALESLVADLEANHGTYTASMIAEYWLRLSIANTYLWLLMFYFYFHLYLNLFAELLRFGDRVFYKDWWNSAEVSAYWRLWNMPVHYWLIRHVYFPCIRRKMSKVSATLLVFFLSAVMHEVLVSTPFHMIRPWSFLGMMMQVPLVGMTKYLYRKFPGTSIGNVIFWLTFCVIGQPMAILLYTVDYQYAKHQHTNLDIVDGEQCRIMWNGRCVVR